MRYKPISKRQNALKVFILTIILIGYGCGATGSGPVGPPIIPISQGSSCKLQPTRMIPTKSIDLRKTSVDSLDVKLRDVEPNDLLIIDSNVKNNDQVMARIAAAKKVKLAIVADISPDAAQAFLEAPIGKPQIVAVIPKDSKAIEGVYGRSSPQAELFMTQNYQQFEKLNGVKLISKESEQFRARIIKEIQASDSHDLFIMVGHNDNGVIRGPNGEGISIKEINEECLRAERPAIILSCSTIRQSDELVNTLVTPRNLEYDEIASAIKRTQAELKDFEEPNISDYAMSLSESFDIPRQQSNKRRVVTLTVVGSLVIVIALYEVTCEESDPLCS